MRQLLALAQKEPGQPAQQNSGARLMLRCKAAGRKSLSCRSSLELLAPAPSVLPRAGAAWLGEPAGGPLSVVESCLSPGLPLAERGLRNTACRLPVAAVLQASSPWLAAPPLLASPLQ